MQRIWAPWRVSYIKHAKPPGCIFCEKPREDRDAVNYILYRGKLNFVILNAFPYNPGHLMVVPYRHLDRPENLTAGERNEHYEIVCRAVAILREDTGTGSFNIGMNLGRTAGAGIDDHIHTHIVPRWDGDHNFMPVIGETRVISESLAEVYDRLQSRFKA